MAFPRSPRRPVTHKACRKCGVDYPAENFHKCAARPDGLHPWCRQCAIAHAQKHDRANRWRWPRDLAKGREATKRYYERHPERRDRWRKTHPAGAKQIGIRSNIFRRYGLRPADLAAMVIRQGGLCAICEHTLGPDRSTQVDHDHATGLARGILCESCNKKLARYEQKGSAYRDRDGFKAKAIAYLVAHAAAQSGGAS